MLGVNDISRVTLLRIFAELSGSTADETALFYRISACDIVMYSTNYTLFPAVRSTMRRSSCEHFKEYHRKVLE
nr:unnamed protein product [Haemonchus contortus]